MDTIIANGILVSEQGCKKADLGISQGKVAAIGCLEGIEARERIDAKEAFLLPGIIDAHTHFQIVGGGGVRTADDFSSGTRAAAHGGVTTIIDFTKQEKGESLREAHSRRLHEMQGFSCVDFGLHSHVTDPTQLTRKTLQEAMDEGFTSYKLFTTYAKAGFLIEDGPLHQALSKIGQAGGLATLHAENDSLCRFATEELLRKGKRAPKYHAQGRPTLAETEAVSRAVLFAKHSGSLLYFVHLSCRESVAILSRARENGVQVMAETCPQYLILNAEKYLEPNGHHHIATPPLRSRVDQAALWQALADGTLSAVATDHCAFTKAQKDAGSDCFADVPPGLPGTETLLPLLYHFGVNKKRIALQKLVELLCTNPAKIFGLYPQKGTLAVGSDADLVLFNPNKEVVIHPASLHMASDYSPYEGIQVKGWPVSTMLRGKFLVRDDRFVGEKGQGRFLVRKRPLLI